MLSFFALAHYGCALASLHAGVPSGEFGVETVWASERVATTNGAEGSQGGEEVRAQASNEWVYVMLPGLGNVPLHEVLEQGTPGWQALQDLGQSLESFDQVAIHVPFMQVREEGILLLMPSLGCLGDFNDDGRVNFSDATLFGQAYLGGDLSADLSRNGSIDVFDQMIFLQLVSHGACVSAW